MEKCRRFLLYIRFCNVTRIGTVWLLMIAHGFSHGFPHVHSIFYTDFSKSFTMGFLSTAAWRRILPKFVKIVEKLSAGRHGQDIRGGDMIPEHSSVRSVQSKWLVMRSSSLIRFVTFIILHFVMVSGQRSVALEILWLLFKTLSSSSRSRSRSK